MKNRLSIAILFLIMSVNQMCSLVRTSDKEELINFFESEFMRRVPSDLFEVRSTERFDILLQKRDTYSDRYNYKNKKRIWR